MSVTAKVSVTVTLLGLGFWGEECTVGQVRKQASLEAISKLRKLIGDQDINVITNSISVDVMFLTVTK